jgi:hypothetical protein
MPRTRWWSPGPGPPTATAAASARAMGEPLAAKIPRLVFLSLSFLSFLSFPFLFFRFSRRDLVTCGTRGPLYSEGHMTRRTATVTCLRSHDLDTVDDPRRSMMSRPNLRFRRTAQNKAQTEVRGVHYLSSLNGAGRLPCPSRGNAEKNRRVPSGRCVPHCTGGHIEST